MENTVIRRVDTTAMLVGPRDEITARVSSAFERVGLAIVLASHVGEACDHIAAEMPHVVIVLGSVTRDEHESLLDRSTAVGAVIFYADPALDDDALDDFASEAARIALERKSLRDEPPFVTVTPGALDTTPPAAGLGPHEATTAPPPPGGPTLPPELAAAVGAVGAPSPPSTPLTATTPPGAPTRPPISGLSDSSAPTSTPPPPDDLEDDVDSGWGETP